MKNRLTILVIFLLMCSSFINQPTKASASKPISNEKMFEFLKEAYSAQVSLTAKYRSYDEVWGVLSPYFKDNYIKLFLKENLYEDNEGFIVYGTDFPIYFIPFFSYSEETKIVFNDDGNKAYVYEFFKAKIEGPVSYDSHYETLTLERIGSNWFISELEIGIEKSKELDKIERSKENVKQVDELTSVKQGSRILEKFLFWDPFRYTIYSLLEMDYRSPLYAGYLKGILK
ncbi:DUF3993 domain-containing protein [Ferdinandcohnia quinoae]|uniref:DUF3993 domain-containing protein n=1 Tax=Fredinandcohnia quinoae TaxID=2918902 RepID=A0AAW5DY47_9BACI|nr:DUF3993 domain-containing protein [Fredinandcohnia sp. SECRCQ15]MCH1623960.1 DUF3993 domain-containing protein [Fredinandcohnia sp. SECRCQ15]